VRVAIEKLVYGGAGLGRTEEGVVFVPRTAPGDLVEVDVVDRKRDYSVGRVTALLEPSADRQPSTCPSSERAGCCHWDHIRYERQLDIKESVLRETLQRTAGIRWDGPVPVIAGPDQHFRLRASFHVRDHRLGFREPRSHVVTPVASCAALVPELNAFIPEANAILAARSHEVFEHVRVVSGPPVLASADGTAIGADQATIRVNACEFDLHPDAFFQPNRYLLSELMDTVTKAGTGTARVLDLFCGSGFFTVPLSRQADSVVGIERSRKAVERARVNVTANQAGEVTFLQGPVESMLHRASRLRPDLVVINPPRTGCGRRLALQVSGLGAQRVVYVSCNTSTFAREAVVMLNNGYRLTGITMVDQFPNTYHIELVAVLEKRPDPPA
jgi:23S rRNA (uracil1939-C5)-methyltransferase